MKSTELIVGEVYTTVNFTNQRRSIFEHNNENSGNANISFYSGDLNEPSYYSRNAGNRFSNYRDIQLASPQEKEWLIACIIADKLIPEENITFIKNTYEIY